MGYIYGQPSEISIYASLGVLIGMILVTILVKIKEIKNGFNLYIPPTVLQTMVIYGIIIGLLVASFLR